MTALSARLLGQNASTIHEQEQSPLFAKLPPELRAQIWSCALTAYNDPDRPYELDTHYTRPGHTHAQKIDTPLLRTCRRTYVEACHLPLAANTVAFWCYRGPRGEPDATQDAREQIGYYEDTDLEEDDTPWHFAAFRQNPETPIQYLRSAHWLVQQYWLECDNFLFACTSAEMAHVEDLTVTLRRSDWWNWEQSQPIGLDPRLPVAVTASRMKETWTRELGGRAPHEGDITKEHQPGVMVVPHHPNAWGSHLRHMAHLRRFTFEIEGELSQNSELQAIVRHASQHWTFRHHSGRFMHMEKGNVGVHRWTGPPCLAARAPPDTFQRVSHRPKIITYSLRFSIPK